jgi:uracil-DNA glycosylase family 4
VSDSLSALEREVTGCRRCPRLVEWRERVAAEPPRRYREERYWARPLPGFGDPRARVVLVGLAPAAHGGNRTGRIFTGDRSGDWLFASLHRVGLARQEASLHAGDGQQLIDARMVATVRCAPPDNKPTVEERDTCAPWLLREIELVAPAVGAVVCLGSYAWESAMRTFRGLGYDVPRPKPRFGHGAEVMVGDKVLLGCYHPSQQNTFTGKLTEPMLDAVLARAKALSSGR